MSNYILEAEGVKYNIRTVGNQSWGGAVQTVVYESAGTDGGVVVTTGRNTNVVTLTGQITSAYSNTDSATPFNKNFFINVFHGGNTLDELNAIKDKIVRLRDRGVPVKLITPVGNNDSGIYIISEFTGNVVEGNSNSLPFTMKLTEYKQANLKRTKVNLVNYKPAQDFVKMLSQQQQGQT